MYSSTGTIPKITNLTLADHTQEYSYAFGPWTKKILIQPRNFKDVVFALKPGETDTNFMSLYSGAPYFDDHVIVPGTFYFKSPTDNTILEIMEWSSRD